MKEEQEMRLNQITEHVTQDCECNYQDNYYGDQVCVKRLTR